MAKPPNSKDADDKASTRDAEEARARAAAPAQPIDEEEEEEDDEEDWDDDDDDEELVVYSASEAAGAFATVTRFVRPYFRPYRKALAFVGFGLLVETLFNVIMPLSLKFLIDEALGEEDFGVLMRILTVLAIALFRPWMLQKLINYTTALFEAIPGVTR